MDAWKLEFSVPNPPDEHGRPQGGTWRRAGGASDDDVVDALERLREKHGCARATKGDYVMEMRRSYMAVWRPA